VLIVTSIIPGRLHGWTGKLLRFPVLGMTYMLISVELIIYTIIRFAIRAMEGLFAKSKHRAWRKELEHAKTYEKWYDIAKRLDRSQGREQWQNNVEDDTAYRYSWPFIRELLSDLKASRENKDVIMALAVLQQCTRKNVGGIMSDDLFSFTNCGEPKNIVSEFVDEVEKTLLWVTEEVRNNCPTYTPEDDPDYLQEQLDIDRELRSKTDEEQKKLLVNVLSWATLDILSKDGKKKQNGGIECSGDSKVIVSNISQLKREEYIKHIFLKEKVKTVLKRARAAYGRTALCLSGGAMMGNYHFGAVKALLETDLLPHIISGTSAGSVIGAMICTRTEEELARDMRPDVLQPQMKLFASSWGERIARLYRHGTMFDHEDWHRRVRWFTCGDMTFEEAYKKTGRVFCVSLSATSKKAPPILVNYITAPNVVIASAVVASASVPGFINATKLQVKDENGNIRYQAKSDEAYRDGSIDSDIPTTGLAEMLNCRFFLAAQSNPHIVPFFYNAKGDVGRPSRWSSGARDDSWRGGFLLSALEMYLKNDMRSKFHFLNDLEVAVGFTSTMMTQVYSGSTTIVPQVCLRDFLVVSVDMHLI
jgi:predicted acylesterase/phospholipase RssA